MRAKTILFLIIVLVFIACMAGYKCMATSDGIDGFSGCTACKKNRD